MADTKKPAEKGAEKIRETINEKIVDPAKKAGEALKSSGSKLAEGGSTVGMKLLDQAEENTRQAFAAMRAAAKAKDVTEVMKVQGDYLREQGSRSMNQAREIGDLIVQFGKEAVAPLSGKK
ncbi:MAG: phasin [Sphingomonas sp. 28-66-16]|nr:MAG: phasin [Sphingomonas sp. 28-66-16]